MRSVEPRAVIDYLGLSDDFEDPGLEIVCQAVSAYVDGLPSIERVAIDQGPHGPARVQWAETTYLGALMLAARLYRRRNSPAGVEAVGDSMTYVTRYDSDISRLLRIDQFNRPVIG